MGKSTLTTFLLLHFFNTILKFKKKITLHKIINYDGKDQESPYKSAKSHYLNSQY